MAAKIIKKLSIKKIIGKRPLAPENGVSVPLCDVIGVATGYKTGETDKGPYVMLQGAFQAQAIKDPKTGELGDAFRTGAIYLPDVALNMIVPVLDSGDISSVKFGFRIGVTGDDSAAVGYVYYAEDILQIEENDPLEALLAKRLPFQEPNKAVEDKSNKNKAA